MNKRLLILYIRCKLKYLFSGFVTKLMEAQETNRKGPEERAQMVLDLRRLSYRK